MQIKAMKYLQVLTEAISSANNVCRLIEKQKMESSEDYNGDMVYLEGNEYLTIAYAMDTARYLFEMMPENMHCKRTDVYTTAYPFFYLHKHKSEEKVDEQDVYNLRTLNRTISDLHSFAHDLFQEAHDAIALFGE